MIVIAVLASVTVLGWSTKKYNKSVADFLAANRCGGRYALAVATGVAGNGAISIIAFFEMYYTAGFSAVWLAGFGMPLGLLLAITGWVIYRYRQTRVMTLAQFFEVRYSRNFRIFSGILAFLSGIINFGIFPSVGARFFIYFCGWPETIAVLGLPVSTFAVAMIVLIAVSLFFTFLGGQITVIVTDFFQGMFSNIMFAILTIVFLFMFDWSQIIEGLKFAPSDASMLNPFHTSGTRDFNIGYFAIMGFAAFYNVMGWQGSQAYDCSAKNAHEARMARVLGTWRTMVMMVCMIVLPVFVFAIMHNPDSSSIAQSVNARLSSIENAQIQKQMIVSTALIEILPVGLIGAFCALMLVAFISTHDTYMHSWGSIFIQDVILPIRKKPLTPKQHMWLLRLSIVGVSVFIFFFSLWFRHTSHILLFFQITAAIFLGGSGSVIIGGLYWKKGTTAAAWCAMIVGSALAVSGIVIHQLTDNFPVNEMVMYFIATIASSLIYIIVSLLGKKENFNMDRMLHRGRFAIKEESGDLSSLPVRGLKAIITRHFTFHDKIILGSVITWTLGLWSAIIFGTIYYFTVGIEIESWAKIWHVYVYIILAIGIITTIWMSIGGIIDIRNMFRLLRTFKRNEMDDGTVVDHHLRGEKSSEGEYCEENGKNMRGLS
jgi:SSS family solute:Na+ symporter